MHIQSLVMLVLSVCLVSCLSKEEPPKAKLQKGTVSGEVIMSDWKGKGVKDPEARVIARFVKRGNQMNKILSGISLSPENRKLIAERAEPVCQIEQESKTKKGNEAAVSFVSLGKMGIGHSSVQALSLLTEASNHLYTADLKAGVQAGRYNIQAEGTKEFNGFAAKMSMPESLSKVVAAGQDFEVSATAFRKSEDLNLSWEIPASNEDSVMNQIELVMLSEDDKTIVTVTCGAMEKDLPKDTKNVNWQIPSSYLKPLHATPSAFVLLKRAHLVPASDAQIGTILFGGIRVAVTQALISE